MCLVWKHKCHGRAQFHDWIWSPVLLTAWPQPISIILSLSPFQGTSVAPVFSNCSRADVRIPAAKTPSCNDYDMATGEWANMTNGYLYSPGLNQNHLS